MNEPVWVIIQQNSVYRAIKPELAHFNPNLFDTSHTTLLSYIHNLYILILPLSSLSPPK
ncbi:hypothetical protein HanRHA438_Chr11g0489181 [Helianthus annuus]|nr:hypothetical protein HanRHA438_Chr11g0489181 [Helianthus annuus]